MFLVYVAGRKNVKLGLFTFVPHRLDLDLNDQTTGASSDDGFIYKKIYEN